MMEKDKEFCPSVNDFDVLINTKTYSRDQMDDGTAGS